MFVPRLTNGRYVVYVFSHHTDIYFRQDLFSLIPSPLSPLSLHRGAYDSPLHLELACLSAIRCSSASGAADGARARQGVLVGYWPLARCVVRGARRAGRRSPQLFLVQVLAQHCSRGLMRARPE